MCTSCPATQLGLSSASRKESTGRVLATVTLMLVSSHVITNKNRGELGEERAETSYQAGVVKREMFALIYFGFGHVF